jgi:hypothetical protein
MAKYDALLNKLWPGDEGKSDRAIARSFIKKFENVPVAADRIEPLLREAARIDGQIHAGAISRDEGHDALNSFISEGLGTPPHIVNEINAWSGEITAELAAAEAPPPTEAEQPAAEPQKPAAQQPPAQPAPVDRSALQQRIAAHEKDMREPQGSEGWNRYWRGGGSQDYLAALQGLEAADVAPAPLPAIAVPAPAPVPAEPAPAPALAEGAAIGGTPAPAPNAT